MLKITILENALKPMTFSYSLIPSLVCNLYLDQSSDSVVNLVLSLLSLAVF